MFERLKSKIPKPLRNRYILVPVLLFFWLLIFEDVSIPSLIKMRIKRKQLIEKKEYQLTRIQHAQNSLKELTTDKKALEKYARETFRMKKASEDVFVFVEEDEETQK